ncbi:MAG: hypothetical protein QXJ58_06690 [Archaeoglobaceae archaeon]
MRRDDVINLILQGLQQESEELLDKALFYARLLSGEPVSMQEFMDMLLQRIAMLEKGKAKSLVVPLGHTLSGNRALELLNRIDREFYKPCLDIRKHRNFLLCLLNRLNAGELKPLSDFLQKLTSTQLVWITDLIEISI